MTKIHSINTTQEIKSKKNNNRNRTYAIIGGATSLLAGGIGYKIADDKSKKDTFNSKAAAEKKYEKLMQDFEKEKRVLQDAINEKIVLKAKELDPIRPLKEEITKHSFDMALAESSFKELSEVCEDVVLLFDRWYSGQSTEMPNAIMISGKDEKLNNSIINWLMKRSECETKTFNALEDDILTFLESRPKQAELEKNMPPKKKWCMLNLKNFDDLINPSKSEFEVIEGFKSILSDVAEEFSTTIIFSTTTPEQLDSIATESHRISFKLDVDKFPRKKGLKNFFNAYEKIKELSAKAKEYENKAAIFDQEIEELNKKLSTLKEPKKIDGVVYDYKLKGFGIGLLGSLSVLGLLSLLLKKKDGKNG